MVIAKSFFTEGLNPSVAEKVFGCDHTGLATAPVEEKVLYSLMK